ncbi:MAG: pyridoxal-phosphate dependent enzyme, partial [Clostridiales bacterium]|nr:pyridoxal-phosphate dependent enzyme [Clostridiales bacterium]
MITIEKFKEAREVLSGIILDTKLVYSKYFSKATGNNVYLKPENMQITGAYKVRGAYYKVSTLSEEQKQKGLITASAGNHAQGVAFAAQASGLEATIVMPTTTPLVKVNNTKDYGAKVVLQGTGYDDCYEIACKLAEEHGYTFIHPFNDLEIATGQGTIAYEILQDLPDVDIILVPIGGGGLAAGVSTLVKLLNPSVKVIGVEPKGACAMYESLKAGKVVSLPCVETIADGVAVKTPGDLVFPYIRDNIDEVLLIDDDELVDAFLDMMEKHK